MLLLASKNCSGVSLTQIQSIIVTAGAHNPPRPVGTRLEQQQPHSCRRWTDECSKIELTSRRILTCSLLTTHGQGESISNPQSKASKSLERGRCSQRALPSSTTTWLVCFELTTTCSNSPAGQVWPSRCCGSGHELLFTEYWRSVVILLQVRLLVKSNSSRNSLLLPTRLS